MKKGLERLFWIVGGFLVLPFVVQQGIIVSQQASPKSQPAQLRSMSMKEPVIARPAIATSLAPANEARNDKRSGHQQWSRQLRSATETTQVENPDTALWSASRIAAWGEAIDLIDRPIGTLLIPALDVEVPLFPDTNEIALTLGAGLISGTADLNGNGNVGMASHRDGHFRHLKNVSVGDLLLVKTDHRLRQYLVVDTRVVEPSDTWVLDPSEEPSITLVTCYPFHLIGSAPQRYIVSAQEVRTDLTAIGPRNPVIGGHHATLKF